MKNYLLSHEYHNKFVFKNVKIVIFLIHICGLIYEY
jgi:hypothetical protein